MKTLVFLMCYSSILSVQSQATEEYAYCKSCLAAAQEIEKAMKAAPKESRRTVVKDLISGGVCDNLLSDENGQVSKEKMKSSCMHLFEFHYDKFNAALKKKGAERLDILLCYEQSTACVGVKHQSSEGSEKATFSDSDIEALLRDNKEILRIARPTHSDSHEHARDEL